jgi:hypothetical protein
MREKKMIIKIRTKCKFLYKWHKVVQKTNKITKLQFYEALLAITYVYRVAQDLQSELYLEHTKIIY